MDVQKFRTDLALFERFLEVTTRETLKACKTMQQARDPRACTKARDQLTIALACQLPSRRDDLEKLLVEHSMFSFSRLGEGPTQDICEAGQ